MGPFLCGEGMDPEAIFSLYKIPGKKAPCADCRGYPGAYADGKYQRGRTAACNSNRKSLMNMLTIKDSLALYRDFYEKMGIAGLFAMPAPRTLEWADVYPFLYLRAAFEGLKQSGVTKHLVIDEMQDYTPIQYAVLNEMFRCPKTILGDFGQRLNPDHLHTLKDIRRMYKSAEFVMLNKSYRSTYEIISFARRICPNDLLEAMERHGEEPQVFACVDRQAQIGIIREEVQSFEERREMGKSASMGIILKTDRDAEAMYDALARQCKVTLISPESTGFSNGVSITSVRMAKGLEFDEVVVADADKIRMGPSLKEGCFMLRVHDLCTG